LVTVESVESEEAEESVELDESLSFDGWVTPLLLLDIFSPRTVVLPNDEKFLLVKEEKEEE
jgi:hypothetical protein